MDQGHRNQEKEVVNNVQDSDARNKVAKIKEQRAKTRRKKQNKREARGSKQMTPKEKKTRINNSCLVVDIHFTYSTK